MCRVFVLLLAVAIFLISGCRSFTAETSSPIYDPNTDSRFDARLVGVWLPTAFCVDLEPGVHNSYLINPNVLSHWQSGNPSALPAVYLVKIGKYDYLISAPEPGKPGTSLTGMSRVAYRKDSLIMQTLNLMAVSADLEAHPGSLKHEWIKPPTAATEPTNAPATEPTTRPVTAPTTVPTTAATVANVPSTQPATPQCLETRPDCVTGNLLITDSPEAIRAYLIAHEDDPAFFSEPIEMVRIK